MKDSRTSARVEVYPLSSHAQAIALAVRRRQPRVVITVRE
jgi:hypothetical protein